MPHTETQQLQNIKHLIDIALRRKAIIISGVLLSLAAGLAAYLVQPKVFMSSCLLSYQQQNVNPNAMSPDKNSKIKDIVSTLTQIVSSRTSLEQIITTEGLYAKARESLPMEDVVDQMRSNINIVPSKEGDTFQISFMGNDPNKVVRVTNALSSRFIEENMKYREERASETSAYTKDELSMVKEKLDSKEATMRDYKLKYYNEMADQRAANTERLIALQSQYQSRQDSIQSLEQSRILLLDRIAANKQALENSAYNTSLATAEGRGSQGTRTPETLEQLQAELRALQMKYTEEHPKIKSLKNRISHFEAPQTDATGNQSSPPQTSAEQVALHNHVKELSLNIEKTNREKEEIKLLIQQYEQWVAAAPTREAEWSALTREYGELKRRYDFLVGQNLQADSALNLERKQKGSQFKIEDPARKPEKPIKPDFLKIIGMALFIGFGLGGGLAFVLEILDTSFRNPSKFEETLQLEVICSIPHLPLAHEVSRKRRWTILGTAFFLVWGLALLVAFILFWKQGRIVF